MTRVVQQLKYVALCVVKFGTSFKTHSAHFHGFTCLRNLKREKNDHLSKCQGSLKVLQTGPIFVLPV